MNAGGDPRQLPAWKALTKQDRRELVKRLSTPTADSAQVVAGDQAPSTVAMPGSFTISTASTAAPAGVPKVTPLTSVPSPSIASVSSAAARAPLHTAIPAGFPFVGSALTSASRMVATSVQSSTSSLDLISTRGQLRRMAPEERAGRKRMRDSSMAGGDKELARIQRILARGGGATSLLAGGEGPGYGSSASEGDASGGGALSEADAAIVSAVRAGAAAEAPAGTLFYHDVRRMMHAFGDAPDPTPEAAVALERHVLRYTRRLVTLLRAAAGDPTVAAAAGSLPTVGKRSGSAAGKPVTLRVRHFLDILPRSTRLYFRWKTLKDMSSSAPPPAAPAAAAAAAAGGVLPGASPVDAQSVSGPVSGGASEPGADLDGSDDVDEGLLGDDDGHEGSSDEDEGDGDDGEDDAADDDDDEYTGNEDDDDGDDDGEYLPPRAKRRARKAKRARKRRLLPAPSVPDDEDEQRASAGDSELVAVLTAEAEESIREGTAPPGASPSATLAPASASSSAVSTVAVDDPTLTGTSEWAAFAARLAFANTRSARMTALQYAVFCRAREAGFTNGPKAKKRFIEAIAPSAAGPQPAPPAVEVLAYLAYDRVGSVVEAALRILHGGALTAHAYAPPLDIGTLSAAMACLPDLPPELETLVGQVTAVERRRAEMGALAAARNSAAQAATAAAGVVSASPQQPTAATGGPAIVATTAVPVAHDVSGDEEMMRFIAEASA